MHIYGLYDSCIIFLQRLLVRMNKDKDQRIYEIYNLMNHCKIESKIYIIITTLSSKTDISPKRLISLLILAYNLSANRLCKEFFHDNFIKALISLLKY